MIEVKAIPPTIPNLFRSLYHTYQAWVDERFAQKVSDKLKSQGLSEQEISEGVWAAYQARQEARNKK